MLKPTVQNRRPAGFTLIEVLLAMAIMATVCGTIYQFTGTTLRVADVAERVDSREQALGGLRRLLAAQFAALPASESQALSGAADDGKHGRADTLQMLCPAGSAVLTPDARGLYQVRIELREIPSGSGRYTLVMDRLPWSDDAEERNATSGGFQLPTISAGGFRTSTANGSGGNRPAGWVRLLDGVRSLEIDYFDPRLNSWVDKWNDATMTPSLVRMRLATENGGAPYEFVEKVPGGGLPRGLAAMTALPPGLQIPNSPGGNPNLSKTNPATGFNPANGGIPSNLRPPSGPPPTLPPNIRPPSGPVPGFNPNAPLMAPDTGTGL